jgi:hypothetical protein
MENINRDTAQGAAPQNDWQTAENNDSLESSLTAQNTEPGNAPSHSDETPEAADERLNAARANREYDDDEEDKEDKDDDAGDWGHVDPAEGNSPFPDSNDPTAPGSAV